MVARGARGGARRGGAGMVRLEHVGLSYAAPGGRGAEHAALEDVSFSLPAGGFRWLMGPSGAGKTSLLRLLTLAALPSRGRVHLLGHEIGPYPGPRPGQRRGVAQRRLLPRLRRRIGVVFQDFRLLPHLSAHDNVALPLRLAGHAEAEVAADVAEMLGWVGLTRQAGARPAQLSGGEQQRVAIARAVVTRPELLLADEPTGNLDDVQAMRLMQLLGEMRRLGTTIVVATHNEGLVERHPGRALRLDRGRLVSDV
ncbi:MAG: cell division ATP-binding protein FtsE [Janthinobacterium lividum]